MSDIPEIEINFSDSVTGMTIPEIELDFLGDFSDLISQVERALLDKDINLITVGIKGNHTVDDLIKIGFLPTYIADTTASHDQDSTWALIDYYIEKFKPETINFWFKRTAGIEALIGETKKGWYFYANIKGWKDFASKTSTSFPLLMYAPDQVYKSKRPRTDMLMFRQATSAIYNQVQDSGDYKIIIGDNFKLKGLPVTRYAGGMSKGLYYSQETEEKFCGTFYYLEPESTTYLTFNSFLIFKNKYEAAKSLIGDEDNEFAEPIIDRYYNQPDKFPHLDLMMTPSEYSDVHRIRLIEFSDARDKEYISKLSEHAVKAGNRKHYVGKHLHLYALEDDYDQIICQAAREEGYDVIILTHMVGSFQLVTEILDTRDRLVSFSNLTYPRFG